MNDTVCRGASVVFTCTTVGATGYLKWINSSDNSVTFDNTNITGDTGTLGNITLNLTETVTHSEPDFKARIYTSTATITNITQDTTIWCSDGRDKPSHTVQIRSKLSVITDFDTVPCNSCCINTVNQPTIYFTL